MSFFYITTYLYGLVNGAPEAIELELPEIVAKRLVGIDTKGIFAIPCLPIKEKNELLKTIDYAP